MKPPLFASKALPVQAMCYIFLVGNAATVTRSWGHQYQEAGWQMQVFTKKLGSPVFVG